MRLTQYTDYALRVLIYLSVKESDEKTTINEITEAYGISRNHLTKVVHHLGRINLIETKRGRGGGFTLAQKPEDISIGYVVRHMEEDFFLVECFNHENNNCILTPVCKLPRVLNEALEAYFQVLDEYTIAHITKDQQAYQQLLGISTNY